MVEDWKENRSFWKGLPIFHHSIVPVSQLRGALWALIKGGCFNFLLIIDYE